jgi:hypothetical protein
MANPVRPWRVTASALLGVTALLGVVNAQAEAATVWLCRPGLERNPCLRSLTTTVRTPTGDTRVLRPRPARRRKIDCFYVYPTVSGQPGITSDRRIEAEQIEVARQEASRFSQTCRVFAPVYRQLTLVGLLGGRPVTRADLAKGYADVRAAWREYLRRFNRKRGVVLLGHSQGSLVLTRLLRSEIEGKPAVRRRLVSAILLGGAVVVPRGRDVGGSFARVRACRSARQLRCVVAYNAFSETPPPDSRFGRWPDPRFEVLCTNPASLAGRSRVLRPYFRTRRFPGPIGLVSPPAPAAPTPWVTFPGLLTARCARGSGARWLQVDRIGGQPSLPAAAPGAAWGLHLVDYNIALGNLTALVRRQATRYVGLRRRPARRPPQLTG